MCVSAYISLTCKGSVFLYEQVPTLRCACRVTWNHPNLIEESWLAKNEPCRTHPRAGGAGSLPVPRSPDAVTGEAGGWHAAAPAQNHLNPHRALLSETENVIRRNINITVWARNFRDTFCNILTPDGYLRFRFCRSEPNVCSLNKNLTHLESLVCKQVFN